MGATGSSLKLFAIVLAGAALAVVLLLWRSTANPTVNAASPAPHSTVQPGTTTIAAEIDGTTQLVTATLEIDGQPVNSTLTRLASDRWRVSYQAEMAPGPHEAIVSVRDNRNRSQRFRWDFTVARYTGPLRLEDITPAPFSVLAPGTIDIGATVTGPAPVAAATLLVGNRAYPLAIAPAAETTPVAGGPSERLVAHVSLPAGQYQLQLVVRDTTGVTASSNWEITVTSAGSQPRPAKS